MQRSFVLDLMLSFGASILQLLISADFSFNCCLCGITLWMYHNIYIHLPLDRHLDEFQFGTLWINLILMFTYCSSWMSQFWCFDFFFLTSQLMSVRLPGLTGGPDLSFSFPWNGKIPYHQAAWSQPINMLPVRNKGKAEKPMNDQVWKKARKRLYQ